MVLDHEPMHSVSTIIRIVGQEKGDYLKGEICIGYGLSLLSTLPFEFAEALNIRSRVFLNCGSITDMKNWRNFNVKDS